MKVALTLHKLLARTMTMAWILCVCAAMACCLPEASASEVSSILARAQEHMLAGQYESAETLSREALAISPDNSEAELMLGVSLSRRGMKEGAGHLKRALYLDPEDAETNLELGRYYYELGVPAEAGDYLEQTLYLTEGHEGEFTDSARRYLEAIKKDRAAREGRAFSASISAGMQYDTNVPAFSEQAALVGTETSHDMGATLNLVAVYSAGDSPAYSAHYSYHGITHQDLGEYDTQIHSATLKAGLKAWGLPMEARYIYEYSLVDGYRHSASHALSPSLIVPTGGAGSLIMTYRYRDTDSSDVPVSSMNSGRTGQSHLWAITLVGEPEALGLRGGYVYEDTSARLGRYSSTGHKVFVMAVLQEPRRWESVSISVYAAYEDKGLVGDTGTPGWRERRTTACIIAERRLTQVLELSLSQAYASNESADWRFEYERALTSLLLKARY